METWRSFQKAEHEGEPVRRFVPCYPAAIRRDNDRHDRKAGAAGADEIVRWILVKTSTVPREPAERMRALPKILEGLVLDEIDQCRIRQVRAGLDAFMIVCLGLALGRGFLPLSGQTAGAFCFAGCTGTVAPAQGAKR